MDYMEIKLSQGKVAKVDAKDYGWLSQWKWFYHSSDGYAARQDYSGKKQSTIYMHRIILQHYEFNMDGQQTDHANRNKLDNRTRNLRPATGSQNQRNKDMLPNNTSGYTGVSWHEGKWRSRIIHKKQELLLGRFTDPAEAARAYDRAALKHHGEFATLNFPEEQVK